MPFPPMSVVRVRYTTKAKGQPTGEVREQVRIMQRRPGVVVPVHPDRLGATDDYRIEYTGSPFTLDQLGYYLVRAMDGTGRVFFVHANEIVEDVT